MLVRTLEFKIRENQYHVKVPNNRELLAIETMKLTLTANNYRGMMRANTITGVHAIDTVDMAAYLTILCPGLSRDLNIDSLLDLDVIDSMEVLKVYRDVIAPWIVEWQKLLQEPLIEEEKTSSNDAQ